MFSFPIDYDPPVYRPPSEAQSLLIQVTLGCSHNLCTYCAMYRAKKYQVRTLEDICADLEKAQKYYSGIRPAPRKIFLCDGDALAAPSETLLPVLNQINTLFPKTRRVGIYATAQNILDKSEADLKALAEAKLNIAYLGLESGCDKVLHEVVKGNTAADMKEAFLKIKRCGWQLSVIVMLGVGGVEHSLSHRRETAKIISKTAPDFFSFLTTAAVPGTPYMKMLEHGRTTPLSTLELLEEMRDILAGINCSRNIIFRANHVSNQYPLGGIIPRDLETLTATLDQWIADCPEGTYPDINPFFL